MAEFHGGGVQFSPKPYCMVEKRLFGFLVVSQDPPKIEKWHGDEAVAEEKVLEVHEGEEACDLDAGCWMLDAGWFRGNLFDSGEVVGFVAIGLFDDVSPAIEMIERGLGMGMDVCVPLGGIGALDLLNMHLHLLFRQDLQDGQDEKNADPN